MEFFFGKKIDPAAEQKKIEKILEKYKMEVADEALKKKIYDELVALKAEGQLTIPFEVVLREEIFEKHRPYIEILLDTKV